MGLLLPVKDVAVLCRLNKSAGTACFLREPLPKRFCPGVRMDRNALRPGFAKQGSLPCVFIRGRSYSGVLPVVPFFYFQQPAAMQERFRFYSYRFL